MAQPKTESNRPSIKQADGTIQEANDKYEGIYITFLEFGERAKPLSPFLLVYLIVHVKQY